MKKYWIWLTTIPGIGQITRYNLIKQFGLPECIYNLDAEELAQVEGLKRTQIETLLAHRSLLGAEHILEVCERKQIDILTINDKRYPTKAKMLNNTPIMLYCKGNINELNKSVAIVGARRCNQEDKGLTRRMTEEYCEKGYTVVSGMAKGVDAYAHTTSLIKDNYTIAVLGNGLDICYPKEHEKLMESIAEKGLLISEYAPGTKPKSYYFPQRNRIISAWSDEVCVISPGKNSGALITAEYAEKLNRKVSIFST